MFYHKDNRSRIWEGTLRGHYNCANTKSYPCRGSWWNTRIRRMRLFSRAGLFLIRSGASYLVEVNEWIATLAIHMNFSWRVSWRSTFHAESVHSIHRWCTTGVVAIVAVEILPSREYLFGVIMDATEGVGAEGGFYSFYDGKQRRGRIPRR